MLMHHVPTCENDDFVTGFSQLPQEHFMLDALDGVHSWINRVPQWVCVHVTRLGPSQA